MTIQAQENFHYLKVDLDINNLIELKDNPRMQNQINGLDFDIEIGSKIKHWGCYVFYGHFPNANYKNYGFGGSYHLGFFNHKIDTSIGGGYTAIMRKFDSKNNWGTLSAYHIKATSNIWINKNIGITLAWQFQQRTDLKVYGIWEGKAGLIYKSNF